VNPRSPFAELSTENGRKLLAALEPFDEAHAAAAASAARKLAAMDVCAAALSTSFARRRAKASGKFERPQAMLFTRDGYEQASSSAVARHRSERFAGLARVADLCCGIGADAIALAGHASNIVACDIDPDARACAAFNAAALGAASRIRFCDESALTISLDGVDAAFADPARRSGAKRVRSADEYVPPLDALLTRAHEIHAGRLCVKAAPGIDFASGNWRGALGNLPLEVEIVSERGVCKEATLWCGGFARGNGARRATVIDAAGTHVLDADDAAPVATAKPCAFLGEPDPAIIRAGLIDEACALGNAAPMDGRVAYLTSDLPVPTPFIRWHAVDAVVAFSIKRLRDHLRARGIGRLVVKTRAFPMRPEELIAQLKLKGDGRATVICTTIGERRLAFVCIPSIGEEGLTTGPGTR
jgi:SAM-dependent methyltransferase